MISRFDTKLRFEDDGGFPFVLLDPLVYQSERLGRAVVVPAGFKTDLASIPRLLWAVIPPVGKYDAAAVVHDFLYSTGKTKRKNFDAPRLVTTSRNKDGYSVTTTEYQDCYVSISRADADAVLNEACQALGVGDAARRTIYAGVRVGGWWVWRKYRRAK